MNANVAVAQREGRCQENEAPSSSRQHPPGRQAAARSPHGKRKQLLTTPWVRKRQRAASVGRQDKLQAAAGKLPCVGLQMSAAAPPAATHAFLAKAEDMPSQNRRDSTSAALQQQQQHEQSHAKSQADVPSRSEHVQADAAHQHAHSDRYNQQQHLTGMPVKSRDPRLHGHKPESQIRPSDQQHSPGGCEPRPSTVTQTAATLPHVKQEEELHVAITQQVLSCSFAH